MSNASDTATGGILVTGFEPFGGEAVNPSEALLARLHGERIEGLLVGTQLLPCCFDGAGPALAQAVARQQPRLVLAVGQATDRTRLSFERVALNLIDARIADNSGAQPVDEPVIAGAPPAYFSTLPVKAMAAAAREAGVPAELSLSAGTYVCNAVFFQLMHVLASLRQVRGGFVHIPLLPGQAARHAAAPSMALETVEQGIRAALAAAVVTADDLRVPGGSIC